MNQIPITDLVPATVLTVRSTIFPLVMHWGVVGFERDSRDCPCVWHSQKSDILRRTTFEEFSSGQPCNLEWVPETSEQADYVIDRLQSKEGLPWHLTQANCEMVVRWAVEDKPVSRQLAFGVLCALGVVAVAVAAR